MNLSTIEDMPVQKTEKSRIQELDPANIQFGRLYSDHMLCASYADGQWGTPNIQPYGDIALSPATTFIHYGQAIFEGVKAYRQQDGTVKIFRPRENWKRMNRSAKRMGMPDIPEEIFVEGMRQVIDLDRDWVPGTEGASLYIRPFMFATDEYIGVKPAEQFEFMIITSPAGPYYNKPVAIYVQDKYVRAFPGGIGFTKAAGNYGMSMYPTMQIRKMGYDQILWTDGLEHKYVQEIGTMNVFFIIDGKACTPDITEMILSGVTRDSVITLLREKGIEVQERPISIHELAAAHKEGRLTEAFGTGTAASIAPIASFTYNEERMELPPLAEWEVTNWLNKELADIRYGRKEDVHGWMMAV